MSKPYNLVNFCEIDKYATKSYCAVHDVDPSKNLGDITKVDENELPEFNCIFGGSPCFVAGTKVYTDCGYKNIEDIVCGDNVLTHNGRFMPVLRVGGEHDKEIWSIRAQGFLETYCTDYHPFYVKTAKDVTPIKMHLKDIEAGYYVGHLINKQSDNKYNLSNEDCWLLGRYVADGHVRKSRRIDRKNSYHYTLVISVGKDKVDEFNNAVNEHKFSMRVHTKSTYRAVFTSMSLVNFIIDCGFGRSALTKRIPNFILDLPKDKLQHFFDGYMSGDGCKIGDKYQATTISAELAMGLTDIVQKLYCVGCNIYHDKRPATYIIDGRTVNQHDTYLVRFGLKNSKHLWFSDNDFIWYPVREIYKIDRVEDVYNIEVQDDHTYTANNITCFNCQDFSVAGKGAGSMWKCRECGYEYNPITVHWSNRHLCPECGSDQLDKTRSSLLVEWLRVIRANKPKWGIYENVKNITGKKHRVTFDLFVKELEEYGYNVYWKVLNAKDYGVPQNRERVYVIIVRKELDNGKFVWPEPFDNGIRLKDMLEPKVDDKYYVNTPAAEKLIAELVDSGRLDKAISNTVRTGGGQQSDRRPVQLGYGFENKCRELTHEMDVSTTLMARDYKGFGNQQMTGVIEIE